MKMRKILIVAGLATGMLFAYAGTAFAAGWWVEFGTGPGRTAMTAGTDPTVSHITKTSGVYSDPSFLGYGAEGETAAGQTPSPHGGYSSGSNKCKTCHAVHGAVTDTDQNDSFRLLHDTRRETECNWCHDATTGRSSHRPYGEMGLNGKTVRGEHSVDGSADVVPDSNIWGGQVVNGVEQGVLPPMGDGRVGPRGKPALNCYYCHSVHGADTIQDAGVRWKKAILRNDPAGNGTPPTGDILDSYTNLQPNPVPSDPVFTEQFLKARFCSDCHNRNPNFGGNQQGGDNTGGGSRTNRASHPTRGDGLVEIYGKPNQRVSFALDYCGSCHAASTFTVGDNRAPGGPSDFPHQSQGHKLLMDTYTDTDIVLPAQQGDPNRALPNMDQVCLFCHGFDLFNDDKCNDPHGETKVGVCY